MPRKITKGCFYKFHRNQPFKEFGEAISRSQAQWRVRRGEDVYTPSAADAASLAKDVAPGAAQWHGAHQANYFPHFYPAFDSEFGHVFYGQRGFRIGQMQRERGASRH